MARLIARTAPPLFRIDMERRSFRDPLGSIYEVDDRVVRMLGADATDVLEFLKGPWAEERVAAGSLVASAPVAEPMLPAASGMAPSFYTAIEHPRVWPVTYPYEWPAEMLYDAATLTLDFAESLLPLGWRLKDATPFNVLFRPTGPVFVDVMSFERREPGDDIWIPYAQFVRSFLLPLLAERNGTTSASVLSLSRDGLAPAQLMPSAGLVRRFSTPFLQLATLPAFLERRSEPSSSVGRRAKRSISDEQAQFVLRHTFRRLRKRLHQVEPTHSTRTRWSEYAAKSPYTDEGRQAKSEWISETLRRIQPKECLDVGANTGHFSVLAAHAGANVIGIDTDAVCMGRLWREAQAARLPIIPLVVDLVDPTPARGWGNIERTSFLDRFEKAFDTVMALGVIHHIAGNDRIPVDQILSLFARLSSRHVIVEYVAPGDPMFLHILAGRPIPDGLQTIEEFERMCREQFEILSSFRVPASRRTLLLLELNQSASCTTGAIASG